jgi:putative N6-adenine-specific DNA methylase
MNELFVSCSRGLEGLLEEELKNLGVQKTRQGFLGVYVPREIRYVYLINYCSRIASRVLWPILQFSCDDQNMLYGASRKIPWERYLTPEMTFAIDANVSHPKLRNSLFAAQVMKDALCDSFRDRLGHRPSVDIKNPDLQLNLFIHNRKSIISLDTSGSPLYKRGWRHYPTEASIQETLAASILSSIHYSASERLCDPFCGSGTFLIEAAWMASHTPPGFLREKWGFFHLPEYKQEEWLAFKRHRDAKIKTLPPSFLFGADKNPETIAICRKHLEIAGVSSCVSVEAANIKYYHPPLQPTQLIANPPYGIRLEASEEIYTALGKFLQTHQVPKAHILTPSELGLDKTGMKIANETELSHGGLSVFLFDLQTV